MRTSRKILVLLGILIAVPLLAFGTFLLLFDARQLRPIIQSQLQQRLKRPVLLGDIQLKAVPLSVRVSNLVVSQPEGFASPNPFLQAQEVYVGVALWPLLRKEVNIDTIRLRSPRLEIVRNPAGRWNYEVGSEEPAVGGASSSSVTLAELSVEDGQVAIHDQKAAKPRDVYEHIDLTLKGLGPDRRGSLAGTVRLDTMAAVLSIQSDFDNANALNAKGALSLKSDRNKDALDVVYDIRRGSDNTLTINSLTAKMGALSASASGSVDTQHTPAGLQLRIRSAKAPLADLLHVAALYGARLPSDFKADGMLEADVQVTGTVEKPVFAGSIDATKAQISGKDLAEPVRASELHIDFTPDKLTTRPFSMETGATRLTAQATVSDYSGSSPQVSATIETNDARIEELLRIARAYGVKPVGLTGTGFLTIRMKVLLAGKEENYSGSGSLRDVSLTSAELPRALNISAANVTFSEDRVGFDHLRAALGSVHLEGTGSVRDFARPDIQFDLQIDQVNSAELQQWSNDSAKQPSGKQQAGALEKFSASGTLAVGKMVYDRIILSNFKTTISFAKGILKLDPMTTLLFGGQQTGSITADLRSATPAYAIKAKLSNVDANDLLSSTTSLKQVLSGSLGGNVDLQFVAKPNEEIAKSLTGKVQIQMGPGKLAGVQILNEVANIGKFLGYSKDPDVSTNIVKMTGNLNVQNGLATTNDLFMDLGSATLTGAGTLGMVDQRLNLHVTTVLRRDLAQKNPLGQIGGLLTTVLANQQGELVVPAIVTGTFAQPRFAPDVEQIANLKVRGLLPTAKDPAAFTSGVKGILDAITSKQPDAKSGETPQGGLLDLIDQFRNKKDDKKK